MIIRDLFQDDINRKINGVVKVEQDADDVLIQELDEYVITKDLKKHFTTFFQRYGDSFHERTADIGVWISGFFGSGKSHFLKMLSYLLENKEVQGVRSVDRFRKKFEDDPDTFHLIDTATRGETDTLLFNIESQSQSIDKKEKAAVVRVFAKVFYTYLGFYGRDFKVVKLEQYIDKQGKTEEFRRVFEEICGVPWVDGRDAYVFSEDAIVEALQRVLGMSEATARHWFDSSEDVALSIEQFVSELKDYVDSKPADFRLLFMLDEVGQYVGEDISLLLNLQTLVEEIGSRCGGKVWVVCTGQEAIDEVIKARQNEFSRIQARFKIRLSLTSSSAGEVIRKRILQKKATVLPALEDVYQRNDSVLRNLFTFKDAVLDIKGYGDADDFTKNFPFVPYQFLIMQKVFSEIRKHGNTGKHLSGGERSMLSGFQEAAQKIQDKDEYALAPFYLFYDTVHTFLDTPIRLVIERCQNAADQGNGIEQQDVNVLKLLYLIRYIEDIPANLDNITILMADDIRVDKITMRESLRGSLDRLLSQNYIGRTGDVYNFLTDEEQDIQKEIYRNTPVDTAEIVSRMGDRIFGDIYPAKKYRHGKYDFSFDRMVDSTAVGTVTGGMSLRILTVVTDDTEKSELTLITDSKAKHAAFVLLSGSTYYEALEKAMKVRKYVKQRNVAQLPKSVQDIIHRHQEEATRYEAAATDDLKKAIAEAEFYVDGEHLEIKGTDAKAKLDEAMDYLVSHVYSQLDLITENAETDDDIRAILHGSHHDGVMAGMEANKGAAIKMEEYLEMQQRKKLPTSMADLQKKYQDIPYGWKEIDIAAVAAMLIFDQKVTVKYAGETIQPSNPKLPLLLRKRTEIGKTEISIRQRIDRKNMAAAKRILGEYFDIMDIPGDEDSLISFIVDKFQEKKSHYEALKRRYETRKYPGRRTIEAAITLADSILSQKKDNTALISRLVKAEDDLLDSKEDMQPIEGFFANQVGLFDEAVALEEKLRDELDYIRRDEETHEALNGVRKIVMGEVDKPILFSHIPKLNQLMGKVKAGYHILLEEKREEIVSYIRQCRSSLYDQAGAKRDMKEIKELLQRTDAFLDGKKNQVASLQSLLALDGIPTQVSNYKDNVSEKIEILLKPQPAPAPVQPDGKTVPPAAPTPPRVKHMKTLSRQALFAPKTLETEADIDNYVETIRRRLLSELNGYDGVKVK